jgi:two-component system NtrC family sensor kinase
MKAAGKIIAGSKETSRDGRQQKRYAQLFRKFVLLTVLCSLVPLLLVGWGISAYFTRFAKDRMLNNLRTEVEHHKKIIELFLAEHSSKLQLIAHSHSKDHLTQIANLTDIFEMINRDYWAIAIWHTLAPMT